VDGSEAVIPADTKSLLTTLKHQLRDVIHARINSDLSRANPDELRAEVVADLGRRQRLALGLVQRLGAVEVGLGRARAALGRSNFLG